MMSLTFGLFTQVSGSGPLGPLVYYTSEGDITDVDVLQKQWAIFLSGSLKP